MPFLTELRAHLAAMLAKARTRRDYGTVLSVQVAGAIATDLTATVEQGRSAAYAAQQADLEAAKLLRQSLADGVITADEIPLLHTALRHVTHSAARDHEVTELLAT